MDATSKKEVHTTSYELSDGNADGSAPSNSRPEYGDSAEFFSSSDGRAMQRMGRTQQLVRNYRLFSMVCFVSIATASWEFTIFTISPGLRDGGRAGIVYSYLWNFFGFLPVILSMAEMASMAPIAGSQYHWVSEFSSDRHQKLLSYVTGWMSTLAWQAGNAQGFFLAGTLIQTIILINNDSYTFPNWQGTLLVIAVTVVTCVINIYFTHYIPRTQAIMFVGHIALYLCLLVPVWVLAPQASAREVFLEFDNLGGWPNMQLAVLAGQLSAISAMLGVDTAAHMSEEIKDAGRTVPKSMVWAYFLNFVLSFPAILTLVFAIPDGEDGLKTALEDPSLYPCVYVLRQTMSKTCISLFVAATVVVLTFSNISYQAAVSRDLFAFARDRGVPFPDWFARIDPKRHVPTNALVASGGFTTILSLIYIGSPTAFYAIVSLFVVSILQCYLFSIGSILWRRIYRPGTLPPSQWSLGRWGIATNAMAVVYATWAWFWAFWPQFNSASASDFNWAVACFFAILIGSLVLYVSRARKLYTGPVVLVEGRGRAH